MSNIIIDGSKRAENPVINYKCCKCKEVLLQCGSFNPRWPEQKLIRAVGKWDKDDIAMKEIWNELYPGRPVALQFHLTCKHCGQANITTIPIQHFDQSKLKADYQYRRVIGSEAHNLIQKGE